MLRGNLERVGIHNGLSAVKHELCVEKSMYTTRKPESL